jgi:thymidylate synthase (FAD)
MVEFKFHIKMPMFVARQHFRHRTASVNEMSARYSVIPQEFFVPEGYRKQAVQNKQSSDDTPVPKDPVPGVAVTEIPAIWAQAYEAPAGMVRVGDPPVPAIVPVAASDVNVPACVPAA